VPPDTKGVPSSAYIHILAPRNEGGLVNLIKKYQSGLISKYMHERLKLGATLVTNPICGGSNIV
jgi:hypothetical protein